VSIQFGVCALLKMSIKPSYYGFVEIRQIFGDGVAEDLNFALDLCDYAVVSLRALARLALEFLKLKVAICHDLHFPDVADEVAVITRHRDAVHYNQIRGQGREISVCRS